MNKVTRIGNNGQEELTLNIWLGPSYDVPHLLLSFGEESAGSNRYAVVADYIPRGMTPLGSDPQYTEKYFGDDIAALWDKVYQTMEGVQPLMPPKTMSSRLLSSPARIAVSGISLADAEQVVTEHVHRFLSWLEGAQPLVARLRGSFNTRDDKLRQFYFRGELVRNIAELGEDLGKRVAAANTGPVSEAYVGGGS